MSINQSTIPPAIQPSPIPSTAIKKVVIVGGGTAGWMAAASLSQFLKSSGTEIHLIEAPSIPTVGVGEATLPGIRNFNTHLGIDEVDFIKNTQATFKLGIQFEGWQSKGQHFFHPFADYGVPLSGVEFHQCFRQALNHDSTLQLGDYCLSSAMAKKGSFAQPHADPSHPFGDYKYAFHFDALLYAGYLRNYSVSHGVHHHQDKVLKVNLDNTTGHISVLELESGQKMSGDLFIDCSGFRGLLIEEALNTGYENWSHWLPVNRAVAVGSSITAPPNPYTISTARKAGWQWRIPLQHRMGNGYVYSSEYCSDDEACNTLLSNIEGEPLSDPRQLFFTTGIRKKFWNKNCVALGLSSGFLEPLESTSISLIQTGLSRLQLFFPDNGFNAADINEANRLARLEMERIRDFIILHYSPNQRDHGELWRYCREMSIPDSLANKIEMFKHRGHLIEYEQESFQLASWLSIFYGQGIVPNQCDARAAQLDAEKIKQTLDSMKNAIAKAMSGASSHQDFIRKHCAAPKK